MVNGKMDMTKIKEDHQKRTDRLLTACAHHIATADHYSDETMCAAMADLLTELSTIWREEATATMEAGKRGAKGTADSLRDCATRLAGVAVAIKTHGLLGKGVQLTAGMDDQTLAEAASSIIEQVRGDDTPVKCNCAVGVLRDNNGSAWHTKTDACSMTAAIAQTSRFGVGPESITVAYAPLTLTDAADQSRAEQAANTIDPNQVKIIKQAEIVEANMNEPSFALEVTAAQAPPAWALIPSVPVFELSDDPATWKASPGHTSVSQAGLVAECAMKWWLRYRRGAPERPSWAMIGGSALHACIEAIEKTGWAGNVGVTWKELFAAEILKTETGNPLFPRETWHASKSGKENEAWWNADGPEMVHRYLEWRAKWIAQGWELFKTGAGQPVIELEFLAFIGGVPVKGFIDSVWHHAKRNLIAIIDVKSGSSTQPDFFQQAVYSKALEPYLEGSKDTLVGGFWDARKGDLTGPLVLLTERHPLAELEMRISVPRRIDAAGLYFPNVNSAYGGCNSCSLKRSCPVGSRLGTGEVAG